MRVTSLAFAVVLVAGCAAPGPKTKTVRFESTPPGARVFVGYAANESSVTTWDFIGTTPTNRAFELDGKAFRANASVIVMSTFVPPVTMFKAELNGKTNIQVFHTPTPFQPGKPAPDAIHFLLE